MCVHVVAVCVCVFVCVCVCVCVCVLGVGAVWWVGSMLVCNQLPDS